MRVPLLSRLLRRWYPYPEDHSVESVDLERYAGRWYEIASFPAWFQKGCRCTISEYTHLDGTLLMKNMCVKDGRPVVAMTHASPVPGTNNSQLEVRFKWPTRGDYWIIALDDDYRHVMIGHPWKRYLWIMSRTPSMDDDTYESLVEKAREKGYEVSYLRRTDQSCAARRRNRPEAAA